MAQAQSWRSQHMMNGLMNLRKTFGIDILPVIAGVDYNRSPYRDGPHINSDFLNGLNKAEAIAK